MLCTEDEKTRNMAKNATENEEEIRRDNDTNSAK